MSVSLEKGLTRTKGLSFEKGEGFLGDIEFELEIGDFILYENEESILLEAVGGSLVLETDSQPFLLTEDGDAFILEDTLNSLGTE